MGRKATIPSHIPGFGCLFQKDKSPNWYIKLYATPDRDERRFSTGQTDKAAAFAELTRLAGQRATGELSHGAPEKVRFNELFALMERDYTRRGLATLHDLKLTLAKHLRPVFGSMKVMDLRKRDIEDFVDGRLKGFKNATGETETLSPASVNKLIAYMRRAMSLGAEDDPPLVLRIPKWFKKLELDNVRTGVFTHQMYRAMLIELAPHAKLVLVIGYHLGMRRGEILGLRWEQVDLNAGLIRLQRKQTKAKKPRVAPIYGDMRAWLEMAKAEHDAAYPDCPYVVHDKGERVYSIKTTWNASIRRSGIDKALVHDLRRTAATNMTAAGIARERIKDSVGWETDAMFARYQIGSDKAAVETGQQMDRWFAEQAAKELADATPPRRAN